MNGVGPGLNAAFALEKRGISSGIIIRLGGSGSKDGLGRRAAS
jgi:hypothetical protein